MKYRLMLIGATLIWGSSFVMMKDMTALVSPAWLIATRFLTGASIMLAITWKRRSLWIDRGYLKAAALLSTVYGFAWYVQTVGLAFTTPGKNAFLTATYCVIVPFAAWLLFRRRPLRGSLCWASGSSAWIRVFR